MLMSKKKVILYGDFPKDWPVTEFILHSFYESMVVYDYTSQSSFRFLNTFLHTLRYIFKKKEIDFIFIGFGGWGDVFWAKILGFILKCPVVFQAIISKSNTIFNYKPPSRGLNKKIVRRLISKERRILSYADIIIYDTNEAALFYQNWLNIDLNKKIHILPLCPNPKYFSYKKTHKKDSKLRVIWYGQASKIHGLSKIIQLIRECSSYSNIEFTLVVSIDSFEKILNTSIERLMSSLIDSNVKLVPWKYDHERFSVNELNQLIQKHHVVLGIYNDNEHVKTIWANKEVESLLLGRVLITSLKNIKKSPLNKMTLFAATVEEIKEKLLLLSESIIDSDEIEKARNEYIDNYSQQLDLLLRKISSQKNKK
jgi:hypothetical protein